MGSVTVWEEEETKVWRVEVVNPSKELTVS